jgi:predicted ferric reductase
VTNGSEFWFIARAAGITAYALLSFGIILGLLLGSRDLRGTARTIVFDLHRLSTLSALAFVALHAVALIGDSYFDFGVREVLVPFASPYRPWQVAAGVISSYALAATTLAFYGRRLVGQRAWRTLHGSSLVLYALATLHGITAGSDSGEGWTTLMYMVSASAVMALIIQSISAPVGRRVTVPAFARLPAGLLSMVLAGGVLGFTYASSH